MDLSWYNQLPPNMQTFLLGTGASFTGGIGAQAVVSLLGACKLRFSKKFEPEPIRKALNLVMAEALHTACEQTAEDREQAWHLLKNLHAWMEQEAVADELSKLIDLRPGATLDVKALEESFFGMGAWVESIGRDFSFGDFLKCFCATFHQAAKRQPDLQGQIEINLLERLNEQVATQVEQGREMGQDIRKMRERIAPDLTAAWRNYLERVRAECGYLPLRGIDFKTADATTRADDRMLLADVYIGLDTTTSIKVEEASKSKDRIEKEGKESRPLSALEAFGKWSQMVLLGEPGSGKSTFVRHLCLCLAENRLWPNEMRVDRLAGWPQKWGRLIPVPVVLRELAAWVEKNNPDVSGGGMLKAYLKHWLKDKASEKLFDDLGDALEKGRAVLLLDGLDEVPTKSRLQKKIRHMIEDLPLAFSKAPILVTCRVLSYQEKRWRLEGPKWRNFELASLDDKKIAGFISAWYHQLAAMNVVDNPDAKSRKLREAVKRRDLQLLAGNPLLLTVMALVHTHKGDLPDARALLYEDVVDLLLWRWDETRLVNEDSQKTDLRKLMQTAGLDDIDIKHALWKLAYEAHGTISLTQKEDATADIPEVILHKALRELHPQRSLDWADKILEIIKYRAGLLLETTPGVYAFPHRTFEEYLAACHLSNLSKFCEKAVTLAGQGAFWREVLLLAVGRLVHHGGDIAKPLMLASELCPEKAPDDKNVNAWRNCWLAGQCLLEIGLERAKRNELGRLLVNRLRGRLAELVSREFLKPRQRAEAGAVLGKIGDRRKGVWLTANRVPDIDWVTIDAGPFIMGNDKGDDEDIYDDETPQFECGLLKEPYRISRNPITVAQYAAFAEAGGYEKAHYWTKVGWKWREKEDIAGHEIYRETFQIPNHPIVGVCWYEAVAFCKWLAAKLGHPVWLPTEAQWERAARHTDGRAYPWGNTFDADKCNMANTAIGATSAVGLFLSGNAVCGAVDMAGNVLEWCATKWLDDYKVYEKKVDDNPVGESTRVLRGGAYHHDRRNVRCACRFDFNPYGRDYYFVGFRVVSPGL